MIDIYLDLGFLKEMIESEPDRFSSEYISWHSICKMILSPPPEVRFFDACSGDAFDHHDLVLLMDTCLRNPDFHQQALGEITSPDPSSYHYPPDTDWVWEIDNPQTYFWLSWPVAEDRQQPRKGGVYAGNFSDLLAAWPRLQGEKRLLVLPTAGGRHLSSWQDLEAFRLPINAMVILDNYPGQWPWQVKQNLVRMVVALTPEDTERLEIMLIYSTTQDVERKASEKEGAFIEDMNAQTLANILEADLSLCLPQTDLTVSVIRLPHAHSIHDRHILTNYAHFSSGHSFTYFKRDGTHDKRKDTTLRIEGRLAPDCAPTLAHLSQVAREQVRATQNDGFFQRVVGTKQHRLLDQT